MGFVICVWLLVVFADGWVWGLDCVALFGWVLVLLGFCIALRVFELVLLWVCGFSSVFFV